MNNFYAYAFGNLPIYESYFFNFCLHIYKFVVNPQRRKDIKENDKVNEKKINKQIQYIY